MQNCRSAAAGHNSAAAGYNKAILRLAAALPMFFTLLFFALLLNLILMTGGAFAQINASSAPSAASAAGAASNAGAPEPQACATIRLAETGWTDIAAVNAAAAQILLGLGYQAETRLLSVPVALNAMSTGEIDVFLGLWQPTMAADIKPYLQNGSVQIIRANLTGARYGLAVPQFAYEAGLRNIADIARFKDALGGKIYGIEPGNDANRILLEMIADNKDGLGQFQLVESSEQAMLAEAEAAIEEKKLIVFLAWEPHPMNQKFALAYLSGGEAYFGADGGASVSTLARRNYQEQCPNIGRFLDNLAFTAAQENALMAAILTERQEPEAAARAWLKANPAVLAVWLKNVQSRAGGNGLAAVEKALAGN